MTDRPLTPAELDATLAAIDNAELAREEQALRADEQPAACAKCRQPFVPALTGFEERAQYASSPHCRGCVDRCHDNNVADHRCVICA
ncbi:hypothetical protein AB0I66_21440 [Streptomyces sp. NPDC050439]|uniref:hypothetical protein n=1 Tax=unclassified Streptomyces TaxID=2593676 RepID=UPI0034123005